jgi:hypothetical protein
MQLLPGGTAGTLPPLYATEGTPVQQKVLYVKFFDPHTQWTWYACEYDPKERIFFGYVVGQTREWGEFSRFNSENPAGRVLRAESLRESQHLNRPVAGFICRARFVQMSRTERRHRGQKGGGGAMPPPLLNTCPQER